MTGSRKKRSVKSGLPPGSLVHIGEEKEGAVTIRLLSFDEKDVREQDCTSVQECRSTEGQGRVSWLSVGGVHSAEVIEGIGDLYRLHPLLLEDIMNTDQRPKLEDYGDYIFIVVKKLSLNGPSNMVRAEQVSIVLGSDYIITFEEGAQELFAAVREGIRTGKGRIRRMGADYLLYALIDTIVDNYFAVTEQLGEKVEVVEDEVVTRAGASTVRDIHNLKREMIFLRRSVWPLREVVGSLERGETRLVSDQISVYLRDVYDHVIQVMDTVETYRDMISGMLDIYLSSVSNRLNEVMKVLTIIATLFMPLTFIAGVYGMNFQHMPELKSPWGYPAVLILMAAVTAFMLLYFKRKKWF